MTTETTVIRAADWIVAWDQPAESHAYLKGGDVAFQGNRITYVGPRYHGAFGTEIDGAGLMVLPGLINMHTHMSFSSGAAVLADHQRESVETKLIRSVENLKIALRMTTGPT